jgi:hypothetical protein
VFNATAKEWTIAPVKLSLGRESLGAVATADGDFMFAGGWDVLGTKFRPKYGPSDAVDVFSTRGATTTHE